MTVPDLPMRERIAEALNLAGWTCSGGIHEPGLFHECEDCRETCLAQADAVLTVLAALADRFDAVAEAAAKVLTEPSRLPGLKVPVCVRHQRVIFNNGCPACNKEACAASSPPPSPRSRRGKRELPIP